MTRRRSSSNQFLVRTALRHLSEMSLAGQLAIAALVVVGYVAWLKKDALVPLLPPAVSVAVSNVLGTSATSGLPQMTGPGAGARTPADGSGPCADKVPYSAPRVAQAPAAELGALREVCYSGFFLGHSGKTRTALWVAEHLQARDVGGDEPRTDDFFEESRVPAAERALLRDYKGSGYARGHLAPAADFSNSAKEMAESFSLANMVPQDQKNNSGPWAALESNTRKLARSSGELYVVTGPGFDSGPLKLTRSGRVGVPTRMYKVVYDPKRNRMGAWMMPNAPLARNDWNKHCTSVAQVEQATGLTFFPDMPSEHRTKLVAMSCVL